MYGNVKNESSEKSINTRGFQFYNSNEVYGSTLVMGYWNNFLTLKINPILPKEKRSEKKKFDYDTFVKATLTVEKLQLLVSKIDELNEIGCIGVPSGAGFVQIAKGEVLRNGNPDMFGALSEDALYVVIYDKVDPESGIAGSVLVYEFNEGAVFSSYFGNGSDYETIKGVGHEFMLFKRALNETLNAMSNAVAHSIRNANKYRDDANYNSMTSIMEKLGIATKSGNSGYGGYNKNSGNFFAGNNNQSKNMNEDVGSMTYEDINQGEERLPF